MAYKIKSKKLPPVWVVDKAHTLSGYHVNTPNDVLSIKDRKLAFKVAKVIAKSNKMKKFDYENPNGNWVQENVK